MPEQAWTAFGGGLAAVFATLLMIFLVVTPFCTLGVPYKPQIVSGGIFIEGAADLIVHIDRYGFVWINDDDGTQSTPGATIDHALASGRYHRVVIEADRRARYASLDAVFRAAGRNRVPVALVSEGESVLDLLQR